MRPSIVVGREGEREGGKIELYDDSNSLIERAGLHPQGG